MLEVKTVVNWGGGKGHVFIFYFVHFGVCMVVLDKVYGSKNPEGEVYESEKSPFFLQTIPPTKVTAN